MRTRRLLKSIGFLVLLSIGSLALAQSIPTATLSGRATHEGQGLPGVSVAAKSPALQGTRRSFTNNAGDYFFANLPPGDYIITFALSGFETLNKDIRLAASQVNQLDATMTVQPVTARAVVIGKAESISQTTSGSTTYSTETLRGLPTAGTITAAVLLSPGVNNNAPNGVSISGGQSTENLYTVNGVVIVDNVRSTPTNLYIEDSILETTTAVSGVSAEFGRFTGGVINAITKSGGNVFSGSVRSTLTNQSWNSTSGYRTSTGVNPQEGTFPNTTTPTWEATLGGPILKDMLWFFGAGRYFNTSEATSNVTRFTNIPYTSGDKEYRYEGKLTLTPFQNHTLTGDYIYNKIQQHNYFFPSYGVPDLDSIYDRQQPTELLAINYNGVLTSSLFVDAQYSKKKFTFLNSGSRFTDLVQGTVIRDLPRSLAYNTPIFCAVCGPPETRNNNNYVIKGNWFLSTGSLGSHSIVFGYDDFGGQRMANNFQNGSGYTIYNQVASIIQGQKIYPVIDSSTEIDWWPVLQLSRGSDLRTKSVYLNDNWRLTNRLSVNLGVRWDKNDATDQAGNVTSNDSAFSPRLAVMYDVTGTGKLRVTASYARYVAALQETQAGSSSSSAGTPADFYWYYDGPGINTDPTKPLLSPHDALAQMFNWFQSSGCLPDPLSPNCKVELAGANIGGVNVQIRNSLASPHANEYVLGVSGNIGDRGTFRADAVRREFKDYYDLQRDTITGRVINPISGASLDLGLIVNSNDYRREYTGLHTQFAYKFSDRLNVGGNWSWSHLIGDIVGETSGSGPTRGGIHTYPEYFDKTWNNPVGDLSSDTRHRVRLYGTYALPVPRKFGGLSVNVISAFDSGNPYGAVGSVDTRPYVTNPGYATRPTSENYYFTSRDAFRTEDIYRTDLSLYYTYKIADLVELFISPQVYNVFNSQHMMIVNQAVETRVTNSTSYVAFNPFTTAPTQGARGTGANWNYGPLFGQATSPTGFQQPRWFQISVGLRF
jgi:hypothetical protein